MEAKKLFAAVIFLCMLPVLAECYEEGYRKSGDVAVPDSMDTVKEADVNVMVPRGGMLRKVSSFLVKEDADEYASRKFIEMEGYLNELRKEIEAQKRELKLLREALESMRQGEGAK